MPNRRLIATIALVTTTIALAALPATARQAAPPPAGPEAGPPPQSPEGRAVRGQRNPRGGGDSMSVGAAMKTMDRSLDRLKTLAGDPARTDEALAALGEIERGCLAAKNQPAPREVLERTTDDAGRAALAAEYRRDLIEIMRVLLEAEEAILARDARRVDALLTRVSELQETSHDRFGVKEH